MTPDRIDVPLARGEDAERVRTAAYRFAELKARPAVPRVEVAAAAGGLTARVGFASGEDADEFRRFWTTFRAEAMGWGGFRDL